MPVTNPTVDSGDLLTRSEVARLLGVSPTTVTRWAREGRLACQVTLGGHHRFRSHLIAELRTQLARGVSPKETEKADKRLLEVR